MNKFARTGVGLLLPGQEVSKELPIQHIAPNSVKMTYPHFLELVKELEFLQRYYQEKEGEVEPPKEQE